MNFDEQVARIDTIGKENLPGQNTLQTFDHSQVDGLSEKEFDALPFDAIQLDTKGVRGLSKMLCLSEEQVLRAALFDIEHICAAASRRDLVLTMINLDQAYSEQVLRILGGRLF